MRCTDSRQCCFVDGIHKNKHVYLEMRRLYLIWINVPLEKISCRMYIHEQTHGKIHLFECDTKRCSDGSNLM